MSSGGVAGCGGPGRAGRPRRGAGSWLAAGQRSLDGAVEAVAALLMAALPVLVFVGVVYRYGLLAPLAWVEEAARLCLVWVSFLGAYLALRRGQHIAMVLVRARLPEPAGRVVDGLGRLVLAAFCLVLLWYGSRYAWAFRDAPTPYLGLPTGLGYVAMPVGALLLLAAVAGPAAPSGDARPAAPDAKAPPATAGAQAARAPAGGPPGGPRP